MAVEMSDSAEPPLTDFARLSLPASPNRWLIAPQGITPGAADEPAAVYDVSPDRLATAWIAVVREQPRTRIVAVSTDGLRIAAEQKSAVFGFVDRISFQAMALPALPGSTLAAYSRAETGYWDLGVNRRRLRAWLAELKAKLDADPSPSTIR